MTRYYSFMTGASKYRVQARSRAEAIRIAFEELSPNEDAKAVIVSTLYEEAAAQAFVDPRGPSEEE